MSLPIRGYIKQIMDISEHYSRGKLYRKDYKKNGYLIKTKHFDRKGKLIQLEKFKGDREEHWGEQKEWHPNGQLKSIYHTKYGNFIKESIIWYDNGIPKHIAYCSELDVNYNTEIRESKEWDKNGKLIKYNYYTNNTKNKYNFIPLHTKHNLVCFRKQLRERLKIKRKLLTRYLFLDLVNLCMSY